MTFNFKNLLCALLVIFSMNSNSQPYPQSNHFDGELFHNPNGDHLKSFLEVLKWKWTSSAEKWPETVESRPHPFVKLPEDGKGVVTFINHASFLIQVPRMNILTDPIFSERASPFSFMGPKRVRLPGVSFENLPKIDVVVISHNHYDHLDLPSIKQLNEKFQPLFLVPLGNAKLLREEGIINIQEMDWWQDFRINGVGFVLTPAEHWSARGLFDKNKSLWGGFMIYTSERKIFFAGDTGYGEHFKDIKLRLGGAPDLALLPIGAYEPRWFMKYHHMNPEDAVQAHLDLGVERSIGMHFGTFQLTDEGIENPLKELDKALEKFKVAPESFKTLEPGESLSL